MSEFIYYSFLIVGTILLVKFAWSAIKWSFKVWYYLFACIIIGVLLFRFVVPTLFNFVFDVLLY